MKQLKSICATCGLLLIPAEVTPDGQTESSWRWYHAALGEPDHEPMVAPIELHAPCDFCGARDPQWVFETRKVFMVLNVFEGETVKSQDDGIWHACGICKKLVVQRDLQALIRRGQANQRRFVPEADEEVRAAMTEGIRDAYSGFFAARPGKPKRAKKETR